MAIMRTYLCPDCKGQFDHLHHPSDEPPPDYCPLCGANVSGKRKKRLSRVVTAPAIKTVVSKSADQVYRQMEDSSNVRAQQAAEILGVHPSKLSNMKMTNMKDNLREGDMSYIPSTATKIQGYSADLSRPDGKPLGATFGSSPDIPIGLPGKPAQEMNTAMSSIFNNHRSMVQATVASGKKN